MVLYYLVLLFLLIGAFLPPSRQKLYFIVSFLLLFFLSAFRDISVGTDTASYEWLFMKVQNGEVLQRQEIGWHYFNAVIVYFGGDFQWVLVLSTLVVLLPVFIVAKKYSLNPMLSIFLLYALYIYLQSFNITRQIMAVSIILYSFTFLIKDNKYIHYIAGVLFASFFHITALLCLPIVFIKRIPDKRSIMIMLVVFSLGVGVLLSSSVILPFVADILGYSHYLLRFESETESGLFLLLTNIFAVFFIATSSSKNNTLLKMFVIYIMFYNIVARVPFASRLVSYFAVTQILFFPYYIYSNKSKQFHILLFIVVLLYAVLFFARSLGSGEVIPYINTIF